MFEMNEVIASSSYARGNENNAYKADGVYYLGPGVSPGYAITNFRAHYDPDTALPARTPDRQSFQPRILHGSVALGHDIDCAGNFSNLAVPAICRWAICRKRSVTERDILRSGRPPPCMGGTESAFLSPYLSLDPDASIAFALVSGSSRSRRQASTGFCKCERIVFFVPRSKDQRPGLHWNRCVH